jgi:signal transduction histidine kinase
MAQKTTFGEKECCFAERNETSKRFIQNAIELALSFGDFQKQIDSRCTPGTVLGKTIKRIRHLVRFETAAIYLVDEATSDLKSVACWPNSNKRRMEDEMVFLIDHGFVAWSLRERRGITIFSKDGSQQILLHVIGTYSRIRGLLIGIFPANLKSLPDASLEILSIVLRNAANALESLACYDLIDIQKNDLERIVEQKTETVISYEKQLMQAQKAEAMAVLAGGIAHQFNNALTALMGNLDLLELLGDKNPEMMEYIERLRPISQRMAGLTNQMLAYAQSGRCKPSLVSLNKLIKDVAAAIRRILKPMTRLVLDLPPDEFSVKVDITQLQMVLLAIVGNADESMTDGGAIHISACDVNEANASPDFPIELIPKQYVCIIIQDGGCGMDSETLGRVFEPFFSTKAVGRGLGMAAAGGIVKNHQGWIHLEAEPGRGTCVRVYLPKARF